MEEENQVKIQKENVTNKDMAFQNRGKSNTYITLQAKFQ